LSLHHWQHTQRHEPKRLPHLLFLLRLQLLQVADELLEQFASLRASFLFKLLENGFLVTKPRKVTWLTDLNLGHLQKLYHSHKEQLREVIGHTLQDLVTRSRQSP
jgi:hypothetical protein